MAPAFVLDTDTFTLLRQGHPEVCRRVALHPPEKLALTVITVEEHLSGWYTLLRKARRPEQVALAYEQLAAAPQSLALLQIMTYSLAAISRYEQLRSLKLNIGGMDLRIAAIVLEAGATLVTRNRRDFRHIPGLVIEDWTQPPPPQDQSNGAEPESP